MCAYCRYQRRLTAVFCAISIGYMTVIVTFWGKNSGTARQKNIHITPKR